MRFSFPVSILRRHESDRYSDVVPEWKGCTVVLLGGGPSLTPEQIALVKDAHDAGEVHAIAINDAYLLADFADAHYAADKKWHDWHCKGIDKPTLGLKAAQVRERWETYAGERCTIEPNMDFGYAHVLRNKHFPNHGLGLSLDPGALVTGRNGGFQALNLAILAGATRVILLGYDGKPDAKGRSHWFGAHPKPTPDAAYSEYKKSFSAAETEILEAGVKVINASPGSAIDSFEKMTIEEALAGIQ